VWFEGVVRELLFFLRGRTNIRHLVKNNVSIWTPNAYKQYCKEYRGSTLSQEEFEEKLVETNLLGAPTQFAEQWGDIAPYGRQWRAYRGPENLQTDQVANLIEGLADNPNSRRHVVQAWHPHEHQEEGMMSPGHLAPCHHGFQCFTRKLTADERHEWAIRKEYPLPNGPEIESHEESLHQQLDALDVPCYALSLKWEQRSVDSFLGMPYNLASYALLTHMLAEQVNMIPGELVFQGGDCHIYENHLDQVETLLGRTGRELPTLSLPDEVPEDPADYDAEDISVEGYDPHPAIPAPVAT
jgi:thymidylate synthase